jgi:hypothetical protein
MSEVDIDTTAFSKMCIELSKFTPTKSVRDAYISEIGKVLERASKLTAVAKAQKIKQSHESKKWTTFKGKRYYLDNKYPDDTWNSLVAFRKANYKSALKARGLSKQSWYKLAEKLGARFNAPAFVKNAIPSTGKEYPSNFTVNESGVFGSISITITNAQPTIIALRGDSIIQQAIQGRVKFYETNLRRGVFDSVASVAKKYPGIVTS